MVRKVARPARSSVPTLAPASLRPKNRSSGPCVEAARGTPRFPRAQARAVSSQSRSPAKRRLTRRRTLLSMVIPPYRTSLPPMFRSRILVTVLALWGLAMIVPDLVRVMNPLGSFGFYADNDGLIYSISGPFEEGQPRPHGRRACGSETGSTSTGLAVRCQASKAVAPRSQCLAASSLSCLARRSHSPSPRLRARLRAK